MANIFSQYAQPVRSIQDYQASYDAQDLRREQLGAAKRTNALADLTAEQTRQTMADGQRSQNIIRQVYSGFDPSAGPDALYSALERTGDRAAIDLAGVKRKEAMERRKGESEAGAKDVETENKVIITYRDLIGNAANPQQAAQYVQIMHADPRLKGTAIARVPLDQALSQIGSDPQTFNQWKQQFALGAAKFVEMNKPTYQQQNLGGTMQTLALPGLGGAPTVVAGAPITQSADNRATNETSRANNQAQVGATIRGQNMTDQRQREKNDIDKAAIGKVEWKQDTDGNWIALPKEIKTGERVTPIATTAPGKRAVQAGHALDIIAEARDLVDKGTNSYLGAGIDQAARVVGASTKGGEVAAKLRALEGALMMAQPRMEGPQSDKDVMLYKQMAGQIGDPTVPSGNKKAALDAIEQLHAKYATGGQAGGKPSAAPTKITDDAGYNALPSGATFIGPDGKTRRKP